MKHNQFQDKKMRKQTKKQKNKLPFYCVDHRFKVKI